jgi:hypothetical protein
MKTLVLLDRPKDLNIPYFALGVPPSRENFAREGDVGAELSRLVGTRCADWVRAHRGNGAIKLVATRNHIPPKTAFHINWLVFTDEAIASEFLAAFPQYRLDEKIEKLRQEQKTLTETLDGRTKRGGFDLSRFGEKDRFTIAQKYVETHAKIADIRRYEKNLEAAEGLAGEWGSRL